MASDFESAFRQLLRTVVQEVASEFLTERGSHNHPIASKPKQADESILLLRSREAAKRLQVSERHLQKLTQSGIMPCVRVGQCVRYSLETIQKWIREAESAEPTTSRSVSINKGDIISKTNETPRPKTSRTLSAKLGLAKKAALATGKKPSKGAETSIRGDAKNPKAEDHHSPFSDLLNELGVNRSDLPRITNGDLRRIAEVDIPTMHGWIYMNQQLPEAALNKLRDHFSGYRNDRILQMDSE